MAGELISKKIGRPGMKSENDGKPFKQSDESADLESSYYYDDAHGYEDYIDEDEVEPDRDDDDAC